MIQFLDKSVKIQLIFFLISNIYIYNIVRKTRYQKVENFPTSPVNLCHITLEMQKSNKLKIAKDYFNITFTAYSGYI